MLALLSVGLSTELAGVIYCVVFVGYFFFCSSYCVAAFAKLEIVALRCVGVNACRVAFGRLRGITSMAVFQDKQYYMLLFFHGISGHSSRVGVVPVHQTGLE